MTTGLSASPEPSVAAQQIVADLAPSGRGRSVWRSIGTTSLIRLLELAGFLVLLVTVLFFLVRFAHDPALILAGPDATQDQVEAVRHLYGFDRPLVVQYFEFLRRFLTFDFGNSIQERVSAMSVVLPRAGTTLMLCTFATILNVAVSAPLGLYLGRSDGNRRLRKVINGVVIVSQGVKYYIVGMLLVLVLAIHFPVFPATGWNGVSSWVLPSVSIAWLAAPRLTRIVASSAQQVWSSEMVYGATAFGIRHRTIRSRYVLPNVLVPLISTAGTQFTLMVSGAVILEGLFGIPGLGQTLVIAVQNSDFPVMAASVTLIGVIVFIVTTLSDLAYRFVDPRLRRQGS
jgi:ABC-type dipeptide/oligopeptide/nickel transport system permease component